MGKPSREFLKKIISEIEKIETQHLAQGELDEALNKLNELNDEYPGQYLVKISIAEAYLLKSDYTNCRKQLFLAANLNPSDLRFDLLRALVEALSKTGAVGGMEVNQKISKFGHPACHYLIGLSHYLEFYQKRAEQLRILRILSESELNLESKRDLLRVFFDQELSEEALGIAKKWVDHQPENWTSQVALALAYEQNGMLKFAKETIEKAEGLPGFKTNGTVDQIKEAIRRIA